MNFLKLIKHLFLFVFFTILTQVGGVIWLLSVWVSISLKKRKRFVFPLLYLLFNLIIVPPIAQNFGREKLPVFNKDLRPRNYMYPLLFRNYVNTDLKLLLKKSANELKNKNIQITYLDANFPFYNGFPLLPHLSHNDGKKVDISFMYLDKSGSSTNKKPSVSGYGAYVKSVNITSTDCIEQGYWQYNFPRYLTFGTINNLELDKAKTASLVNQLLASSRTKKIFIEPYLKKSLGFSNDNKVRFHGCKAVRHDDHIHLEIK